MSGVYNASAPPPEDPGPADVLRRLRREGATNRLEAAMGRIGDLATRFAEDEAEEDPVDAQLVTLLVELTHADEASLEWRSLGRRVDDGLTSWETFWARPQDEPGGLRLFAAVMQDQTERTRRVLEEEPPD